MVKTLLPVEEAWVRFRPPKKNNKAIFLSLSKLQRFQEPCVRNQGQRPNIRTKGAPGALTTSKITRT